MATLMPLSPLVQDELRYTLPPCFGGGIGYLTVTIAQLKQRLAGAFSHLA